MNLNLKKILTITLFLVSLAIPTSAHAIGWSKFTIDSANNVGQYTSITKDSSDNYLVSYYDVTTANLKFAKSTDGGTSWVTSTVDSTGNVGSHTSITTDSSNNYLISYYDTTNSAIKFAKSTDGGTSWVTSTVDDSTEAGTNNSPSSIMVDNLGNYVISYYKESGSYSYIMLAKSINSGSSWTLSIEYGDGGTINSDGIGTSISMTKDTNNNYLVVFSYYFESGLLMFLKSVDGGSNWISTTLSSDLLYWGSSVKEDLAGNYFVAYSELIYDSDLNLLKSVNNGTNWTETTIIDNGVFATAAENGSVVSNLVDANGNYLVSYYSDQRTLELAKSTNQGTSWEFTSVDISGNTGQYSSMAMDSPGNYLVSYYDVTGGDLEFAKGDNAPPSIIITTFSPDPGRDNTPSITGTATEAIGTISSVEFQMDATSGSWTACTADDGAFDESSEAFTCVVATALADGSHTVYVRTTDSNGNTTSNANASADTFTIDTIAPTLFYPESPGTDATVSSDRPTFKWRATSTDATSGMSRYVLEIDVTNTTTIVIDNIPVSRTTDYETSQYYLKYENFSDADATNDTISVWTKSSTSWNSSQNDGKLAIGKRKWRVYAYDNAGNSRSEERIMYYGASAATATPTPTTRPTSTPTPNQGGIGSGQAPTTTPTPPAPFEQIPSDILESAENVLSSITETINTAVSEISRSIEVLRQSPQVQETITRAIVPSATAATAVSTIFLLSQLTIFIQSLWYYLLQLLNLFLQAIGITKKKSPWGRVIDSITLKPISEVFVSLLNKSAAGFDSIVETATTDLAGRFGFFVPKGIYYLTAQKNGYQFPSKTNVQIPENIYVGKDKQEIDIKHDNLTPILFTVPMDPVIKVKGRNLFNLMKDGVNRIGNNLSTMLLSITIALSLFALIAQPNYFNYAIFAINILIVVWKISGFKIQVRSAGLLIDSKTLKGIAEASILLVDEKNQSVNGCLTNDSGEFALIAEKGSYTLKITHNLYQPEAKAVSFRERAFVENKIKLNPKV